MSSKCSRTLEKLLAWFEQTRAVHYKPPVQIRTVRTQEAEFMLMQSAAENPNVGNNHISNMIWTSGATLARRELKIFKYHPLRIAF